jgi:hypothetical protein
MDTPSLPAHTGLSDVSLNDLLAMYTASLMHPVRSATSPRAPPSTKDTAPANGSELVHLQQVVKLAG